MSTLGDLDADGDPELVVTAPAEGMLYVFDGLGALPYELCAPATCPPAPLPSETTDTGDTGATTRTDTGVADDGTDASSDPSGCGCASGEGGVAAGWSVLEVATAWFGVRRR